MSGTPVPRPTRGAVFLGVAVTAAVIVALLAAWRAAEALLLIFGAVLLAILFRSAAGAVGRLTRLSPGWSLTAVLLAFFAVLGGGGSGWRPRSASSTISSSPGCPRPPIASNRSWIGWASVPAP